uniref:Uncharacterized protein n=1 Tax=Callorhinchus milii TaxID=7868 RepID=A0A4W3GVV2_CALMI
QPGPARLITRTERGRESLLNPAAKALMARPRLWEGQDVLARWSDGLLYLGNIRKVSGVWRPPTPQRVSDTRLVTVTGFLCQTPGWSR